MRTLQVSGTYYGNFMVHYMVYAHESSSEIQPEQTKMADGVSAILLAYFIQSR